MQDISRTVNDFITDIYGTIVDATQWQGVLDRTASIAGAKAANICLVDHVAEELNSQFMCSETERFYPVYMGSPHMESELKAVTRLPQVQTSPGFHKTSDYVKKANSIFHNEPIDLTESEAWLYKEWSVASRYICRLNIQPSYLDMHTLMFEDRSADKCKAGIEKINVLTLHLAKAVELSRPFLLLKSRFQATLDVLDRFHLGVFIVSSGGSVAMKNSAADRVLDSADAISLSANGQLKSVSTSSSVKLERVIKNALAEQSDGVFNHSTELVIPRRSSSTSYLVEITPLYEPTVVGPLAGLMLIVIDPDYRKIVSTQGMKQMFGLSKAEDSVCRLLVEGYTTEEIAETRNVSPVTVKNQVKAVLSKTKNRSRSELIRQALSINLPVDKRENDEL